MVILQGRRDPVSSPGQADATCRVRQHDDPGSGLLVGSGPGVRCVPTGRRLLSSVASLIGAEPPGRPCRGDAWPWPRPPPLAAWVCRLRLNPSFLETVVADIEMILGWG